MKRIRLRRLKRLVSFFTAHWYLLGSNFATTILHPNKAAFARAVGEMALAWVSVERRLDYINYIILHRGGGRSIQRNIPILLNPKIAFFKKSFERLPILTTQKTTALAIIPRINRLKRYRHDVIHGSLKRIRRSGQAALIRHSYDADMLSSYEVEYHLQDVVDIISEMQVLVRELSSLANDVHAILPRRCGAKCLVD